MTDAADVVEAARHVIRPLVLEHFAADSCVSTTRITIDTLRYFGIAAEPVAVQVLVFNGEAMKMLSEGVGLPELAQMVQARSLTSAGGPWTLGVGVPSSANGDDGRHVAVWVPGVQVVADFSLDQASRPHKNLTLGPAVFPVSSTAATLPEGFEFAGTYEQPDGAASPYLEYRVVPDWFRHSPNWRRTSTITAGAPATFKAITGAAIRAVRDRI